MYRIIYLLVLLIAMTQTLQAQSTTNIEYPGVAAAIQNPAAYSLVYGNEFRTATMLYYRGNEHPIAGSPVNAVFHAAYTPRLTKVGTGIVWGLLVKQSNIGLQQSTNALLSMAYSVQLGDNSGLSIGLGVGLFNHRFNRNNITGSDDNMVDEVYAQVPDTYISPDASAGAMFYWHKFYVGYSMPQIASNNTLYYARNNEPQLSLRNAYHNFFAACEIPIDGLTIKPYLEVNYNEYESYAINAHLNFVMLNLFSLGIGGSNKRHLFYTLEAHPQKAGRNHFRIGIMRKTLSQRTATVNTSWYELFVRFNMYPPGKSQGRPTP